MSFQFKDLKFQTLKHPEFDIDKVRIYNILKQSFRLVLALLYKTLEWNYKTATSKTAANKIFL